MKSFLTIVTLCLFESCTTSYTVVREPTDAKSEISLEHANKQVGEPIIGGTDVMLADGTIFSVRSIQIRQDTTCFVSSEDSVRCVPTADLKFVHRTDRWGGFLQGTFLGGLIGGGVGAGLALFSPHGGHPDIGPAYALFGGLALGVSIGLVDGIVHGHQYFYYF